MTSVLLAALCLIVAVCHVLAPPLPGVAHVAFATVYFSTFLYFALLFWIGRSDNGDRELHGPE